MSKEIKPLADLIDSQLVGVLYGMREGNYMLSLTCGLRILEATYKIIEESKKMMQSQQADERRAIVALVPGGAERSNHERSSEV
jgi:hypothetical protein